MNLYRLAAGTVPPCKGLNAIVAPQFEFFVFLIEAHPVSPMVIMTFVRLAFNRQNTAMSSVSNLVSVFMGRNRSHYERERPFQITSHTIAELTIETPPTRLRPSVMTDVASRLGSLVQALAPYKAATPRIPKKTAAFVVLSMVRKGQKPYYHLFQVDRRTVTTRNIACRPDSFHPIRCGHRRYRAQSG